MVNRSTIKSNYVSFLVTLFVVVISFQTHCFAYLINHSIQSPNVANVIYTENNVGDVDISFSGTFDFTSIGGNMEAFSGNFLYNQGDAPVSQTTDIYGNEHAHYSVTTLNFDIFGSQLTPFIAFVYIADGSGIYSDLFFFEVHFDFFNGLGIDIPNTSEGLIALGLNVGAYSNVITNYDVPSNLNVMQEGVTAGLWAELSDNRTAPVPEPSTIALLGTGLVGLLGGAARKRYKKKRQH